MPGLPVRIPSPKVKGFDRSAGSNFITNTRTAREAEAKPSGMPMARSAINASIKTSEIVPISISLVLLRV